jgi:tRNA (guanine-N7-)-methyltransferase
VDTIKPGSLDEIWVTFPDPFPKDRYAKHRLTHPGFLGIYELLLVPQGLLRFKTDAKVLFDWSLERLVENKWIIRELSFDLHESNMSDEAKIATTYERRYQDAGRHINYVAAIRSRIWPLRQTVAEPTVDRSGTHD